MVSKGSLAMEPSQTATSAQVSIVATITAHSYRAELALYLIVSVVNVFG